MILYLSELYKKSGYHTIIDRSIFSLMNAKQTSHLLINQLNTMN